MATPGSIFFRTGVDSIARNPTDEVILVEHAGLLQENAQEVRRIDRLLRTIALSALASPEGDDQA